MISSIYFKGAVTINKQTGPRRSGRTSKLTKKITNSLPSQSLSIKPPKPIKKTQLNIKPITTSQTPKRDRKKSIPLQNAPKLNFSQLNTIFISE